MRTADPRERRWRGNLVGASSATFAVTFGATISQPFLPIFLNRELGVTDLGELALWSGSLAAVTHVALARTSPLWGVVGDR